MIARHEPLSDTSLRVSNIIALICHDFFARGARRSPLIRLLALAALVSAAAAPQTTPSRVLKVKPPNNVPPGEMLIQAVTQTNDGPWTRLRGKAVVETDDFLLRADEADYNSDTDYLEARGNVYMQHFEEGEELWAQRVEYDMGEHTGRFYVVRGSAPLKLDVRPGILTTTSPFYFEGKWAERLKDKYVLHEGFITNCKMPDPWWILKGPKFDVIPNDRALAYRTIFWLKHTVPLFYSPVFYKSLERSPRKSGFLTPNLGNSSKRGRMVGVGYFWAINRSYDAMYRGQYFTERGVAHQADIRGKPRIGTDFNAVIYGVNDKGEKYEDTCETTAPDGSTQFVPCTRRRKQGGMSFTFDGQSDLGRGFHARVEASYLSSLTFRQAFTESYTEAIGSEVHSIGFVSKNWGPSSLNIVLQRLENFQSLQPDDTIVIRKLPEVTFNSRDRKLWRNVPLWVSWESSAGLLRRKQLLFQTRQFLERADVYPRVMTAFRWKNFNFLPSFAVRGTHWGESREGERILGVNINRVGREFALAIVPPSLERVYNAPRWLGEKAKHVIEPRVSFRHVSGIDDFDRYILFDETELLSNTTEAEISLTNRLYAKRGSRIEEVFSWQLWQRRYFDPDFGGAVIEGRRNLVMSSIGLTPYAFIDRPRRYSPIVSAMRASPWPGFGVEWRTDYDPLRSKVVNNGLTADARFGKYSISLGHTSVRSSLIAPGSNQLRGSVMLGNENRRGLNAGFMAIYDFRTAAVQYTQSQVTYNTDCCGFSVQYRRMGIGVQPDNQWRVAFAVANIGSFGNLKKQDRMF